ncbi:MAG TPA: S8 family serine peptidase, partial [Jatrophihabitantaceae bacterium]|nr:S8 family serine peptidase [Jatrophihabitantaceae bacterium]
MRRAAAVAVAAVAMLVVSTTPALAAPGPSDAPEYWFDNWQIESLWGQGVRGQDITIAEIDTGVNAALPELAGNVLPGQDFGEPGNGQVDRETSTFGHGTAMASIMVGQRGILGITGLAPGAKLLPIAVPLNGTTDASHQDKLADAITWAADHGAKIISMSLGGGRTPSDGPDPCPADEQAAVYHALAKGDIVVAASGNNGPVVNTVEEPGVCLGVVSVGAVDSAGVVAQFSSRHPYLTMTAPGVNVASLSRIPGTAYSGDGTSQATAIASAVFALVWSKYPKLSGDRVIARVLATLGGKRATRDPAYGYGELN